MTTKYGEEAIHFWRDKQNRRKVYKTVAFVVLVAFVVGMKIYYS